MVVLAILISTHVQIPHNTAKGNATICATSYRPATATWRPHGILLISNFVSGIHYLQLKCGAVSSNTTVPTWGPITTFSRAGCFVSLLKQTREVERACIYSPAFWAHSQLIATWIALLRPSRATVVFRQITDNGLYSFPRYRRRDVSYLSEIQPEHVHMSSPPTNQDEKSS